MTSADNEQAQLAGRTLGEFVVREQIGEGARRGVSRRSRRCSGAQLAPLLRALPPRPGAPHELFFFTGQGRRGARFIALPAGFELLDDELWGWMRAHLLDVEADATGARAEEGRRRLS